MRYTAIVVVVAALVAGCAGARVRPDVHEDGWLLVETEHIALRTDLERSDAVARARQLEQYWQALAKVYGLLAPGVVRLRGRFSVVHFDACLDLARAPGEGRAFVYRPPGWIDELVAFTCAGDRDATLLHELAHIFNHHYFPGLPVWVEEGLATYYSTLSVRSGKAMVGKFPSALTVYWYGRYPAVPDLDAIRRMDPARFHEVGAANYFAAWKLVHLLTNSDPDLHRRFRLYLAALSQAISNDEAWQHAFGDLRPEPLAKAFKEYHRRQRLNLWTTRHRWSEPARPRVRPLRAGEAHMLWAVLLATFRERSDVAEQLTYAVNADPRWTELPYWRAVLVRGSDALRILRNYVTRTPRDPRGWMALVDLQLDRILPPSYLGLGESRPAGLAAMERDVRGLVEHASDARALNLVGWYYAMLQKPAIGLNFAIRAVRAKPDCSGCWDTAALLYFQAGKVEEALKAQERAVGLYGERASPDVILRLRRYRVAAQHRARK
jgi:hypothetical protein